MQQGVTRHPTTMPGNNPALPLQFTAQSMPSPGLRAEPGRGREADMAVPWLPHTTKSSCVSPILKQIKPGEGVSLPPPHLQSSGLWENVRNSLRGNKALGVSWKPCKLSVKESSKAVWLPSQHRRWPLLGRHFERLIFHHRTCWWRDWSGLLNSWLLTPKCALYTLFPGHF